MGKVTCKQRKTKKYKEILAMVVRMLEKGGRPVRSRQGQLRVLRYADLIYDGVRNGRTVKQMLEDFDASLMLERECADEVELN